MIVATSTDPDVAIAAAIRRHLEEICGDDLDFARELVVTYLDTAPASVEQLQLAAGDLVAAGEAAHGLKGISHAIGAIAIGDAASKVEHAARIGDSIAAEAAVAHTIVAWSTLLPVLERLERDLGA